MVRVVQHDRRSERQPGQRGSPLGIADAGATGSDHAGHAQREQAEADHEHLLRGDLAGRDRPLRAMRGVEVAVEGIVEEHAADVEEGKRQQQQRQPGIRERAAGEQGADQDVGPDGGQVGDAPQAQGNRQVHERSSVRTQASSRATASSTEPLRNGSGSTPQV